MKVLDLFSGIGGFSLGLEKHPAFSTAAFCEIDSDARKVLEKHWPNVPIFKDIKKLKGDNGLVTDGEMTITNIEVICGGFPCQDLSQGGKKRGLSGERSGLWFEYLRLIREIKPKYAIIENVERLVNHGLEEVLRGLSEAGYNAEWSVIEATHVGLPHRRERVFIIAYASSLRFHEYLREERQLQVDEEWESSETYPQREKCLAKSIKICPILSRRDFDSFRNSEANPGTFVSSVRRVTNGIPEGLDEVDRKRRIKQLGNSIIPQIAEIIGGKIAHYEATMEL